MYDTANVRKFKRMTPAERESWMTSANRVTVDHIFMMKPDRTGTVKKYVAKIRGVIVEDDGKYMFDTPEEAREFGKGILAEWKREKQS